MLVILGILVSCLEIIMNEIPFIEIFLLKILSIEKMNVKLRGAFPNIINTKTLI